MLKVYENKEKKKITAVIGNPDGDLDAMNTVLKHNGLKACRTGNVVYIGEHGDDNECMYDYYEWKMADLDKLMMNKYYSATVTCSDEDEYSYEAGKKAALEKAMINYTEGLRKAIVRWQASMLFKLMKISPYTFHEALTKANRQADRSKIFENPGVEETEETGDDKNSDSTEVEETAETV